MKNIVVLASMFIFNIACAKSSDCVVENKGSPENVIRVRKVDTELESYVKSFEELTGTPIEFEVKFEDLTEKHAGGLLYMV